MEEKEKMIMTCMHTGCYYHSMCLGRLMNTVISLLSGEPVSN